MSLMIKNYHQNQMLIAVNVRIEMQSRLLDFMALQTKNFYPSNICSGEKYPPESPPPQTLKLTLSVT